MSNHVLIILIRFVSRFIIHLYNVIYFSTTFNTPCKRFTKFLHFTFWVGVLVTINDMRGPECAGPANRWAGCAEAVGDMVMCARHGPTAGCRARGDSGVVATPAVRGRHVIPGRVTVTYWRAASTCRTAASRGRTGGNDRASLSPGAGPRTSGWRIVLACGPTAVEDRIFCGLAQCSCQSQWSFIRVLWAFNFADVT